MTHTAEPSDTELQRGFLELALLFLFQLFQQISRQHSQLKALRNRKPPQDWQSHIATLLQCEHNVARILATGIRELLEGRELDLVTLRFPDHLDPAFATQAPLTYAELHRRFEAVALFHTNPERYIRRQAARVMREMANDPFGGRPLHLALRSTSPSAAHWRRKSAGAFPPPRKARGRWHARVSAHDGGGSLHSRGPP